MCVSATIAMTRSMVCLLLPAIAHAILFSLLLPETMTAPSPLPQPPPPPQPPPSPLLSLANLAPRLPLPSPLASSLPTLLSLKGRTESSMHILSAYPVSSARPLAAVDGNPSSNPFSVPIVHLVARLLLRLSLSMKSKRPRSLDPILSSKMVTFSIASLYRSSRSMNSRPQRALKSTCSLHVKNMAVYSITKSPMSLLKSSWSLSDLQW